MSARDILQAMVRGLTALELESGWDLGLERMANLRDVNAMPVEIPQEELAHSFELQPLYSPEQVQDRRLREFLIRRDQVLLPLIEQISSEENDLLPEDLFYWMGALTRAAQDQLMASAHVRRWTTFAAQALASVCVSDLLVSTRRSIASFETPDVLLTQSHFDLLATKFMDRPMDSAVRMSVEEQVSEISNSGLLASHEETSKHLEPSESKMTVIVHGTFAAADKWWRDPSGINGKYNLQENLWNFLFAQGISNLVGHSREFVWSGGHTPSDRFDGARDFLNWWNTHGNPLLDVVAHSHGGNVVMLAQMMEPKLQVDKFVMLGTPPSYEYVPRLHQLRRMHNVYSRYDSIQVIGAWITSKRGEGRTQCDNQKMTNWHISSKVYRNTTGKILHGDLHHPDFWQAHKLVDRLLR